MRANNSSHLINAARQRAEDTRRRAIAALRRLDAAGDPITFDSVARTAAVSRSWLYAHPELRQEIERLRTRRQPSGALPPQRQQASDTSLLRRLEAATERIRRLESDNRELRDTLAQTLGEQRASATIGTARSRDTPKNTPSKTIGPC